MKHQHQKGRIVRCGLLMRAAHEAAPELLAPAPVEGGKGVS